MNKISCNQIVVGACFSEPVFFDDGTNMFLCAGHPAKNYHVAALLRWKIPFLLTDGHRTQVVKNIQQPASFGQIEELDELEELEELEEI